MTAPTATQHVAHAPSRCGHSRFGQTGCTRCMDVCPEGAISSIAQSIALNPSACRGCESCVAACPSGAMRLVEPDDDPSPALLALRGRLASGGATVLVVHGAGYGEDLLNAVETEAGGLPDGTVRVALPRLGAFDIEALLLALAWGAGAVRVVFGRGDRGLTAGLERTLEVADAVVAGLGLGGGRFGIIEEDDPWVLGERLRAVTIVPAPPSAGMDGDVPFRAWPRAALFQTVDRLRRHGTEATEAVALPPGAPFGAVEVDAARCTLCYGCARACPTGALLTSSGTPRLGFVERLCIQCGLCRATCPERAVSFVPRLALDASAAEPRVLKEDEVLACLRCGAPVGPRSMVEKMESMLAGHPNFSAPGATDALRRCERCRGEP
ncbi:MAG TPA: 4Fe-4S binding protein [Azospirillum sp.]